MDTYGDKIGNFGGIDTDNVCRKSEEDLRELVRGVFESCKNKGGFAIGSGNSIPDYVPFEKYLIMVDKLEDIGEIIKINL